MRRKSRYSTTFTSKGRQLEDSGHASASLLMLLFAQQQDEPPADPLAMALVQQQLVGQRAGRHLWRRRTLPSRRHLNRRR